VTGCGWCQTSGTCNDVASDNSGCTYSPICGLPECKFAGGTFVGGMFLILGVVLLAGGAIWLYKWKNSKQVMYSELK